jgi:hypothetical protein
VLGRLGSCCRGVCCWHGHRCTVVLMVPMMMVTLLVVVLMVGSRCSRLMLYLHRLTSMLWQGGCCVDCWGLALRCCTWGSERDARDPGGCLCTEWWVRVGGFCW